MLRKNVRINGRRTSVRLERPMWDALENICDREETNSHQVCGRVAQQRRAGGFTSALRVYILDYYRRQVVS